MIKASVVFTRQDMAGETEFEPRSGSNRYTVCSRAAAIFLHPDHTFILCEAHQESISICGSVSTQDPARETAPSASINASPKASSTEMASIAVRPTPPAQ